MWKIIIIALTVIVVALAADAQATARRADRVNFMLIAQRI
jgi:hypothetical protein